MSVNRLFKRAGTSASLLLGLALVAPYLVVNGCKIDPVERTSTCVADNQCPEGYACTSGACITRSAGQGTWAVELIPRSDSTAAPTQIAAVTFSDSGTVLTTDGKVTVTGALAPGASLAGSAHVIATVPTPIPGHPDLQFETDWSLPDGAGTPPPFSMTVPASLIGQLATFRISPLPPRDLAQPPVTMKAVLAATMNLKLVNSSYFVTGRLATSSAGLKSGFAARAFEGGQLVSNVANVNVNDGTFRLEIPKTPTSDAGGRSVTIEITPSASQYTTPRFVSSTILVRANAELGTFSLPAIKNTNLFRFRVAGPDQQPVVGAIVRVRTVIASASNGAADFMRDGTSDAKGNVDLALIPGNAAAAQTYDISVIPPPSSSLGIACMNAFEITSAGPDPGSGDPQVAASLGLPAKVALSGTILSADGLGVAGVAIAATRTAVDPVTNCSNAIVSPPAGTSSGRDGRYQLLVDPGTYRLDYDPPTGAPVPRLTETNVIVTAEGISARLVQMLTGALVNGVVQGADGTPLSSVGVRFFEVACSGQDSCYGLNRVEPILRAETHTESDGTFGAVVPLQLPPPP